jgi:hypothetical protein
MFSRPNRYLLTLIVCSGFCLFAVLAFSPKVQAAGDPITITAQTQTVTFPKRIDFQMTATDSAAPITQASIYISFNGVNSTTTRNVQIAHFATTETLQWQEDISGSNFVEPGTQVKYYWQIVDNSQDVHTGATQTFTVTDTRFSWQHLTSGQIQVNWYNRPLTFGQIVLTQADNGIKRIDNNLGGGLLHPVNVWVYQNNNDFHGSLPPGTYEWVGGVAFPDLNQASISVETTADTTLIRDLPHELTHLVLHQLVGINTNIPRWFDEGMAVYNQAYHEPDMKLRFKEALNTHFLLRLSEITDNFPADADKAYLAYAQSWNLIGYMYTTFGQPKMATLIKDINASPDFNADLSQALGVDQNHLENQWRLSLGQSATLSPNQANPAPAPHPIQVQVAVNPYAPLLLTLGIVLFVLPLIGLGSLFSYQQRTRRRPHPALQSSNSFNAPLQTAAAPPLVGATASPYTHPARYMPQPAYQPPQTPSYPLPNTPPPQDSRAGGNIRTGGGWPSTYQMGQEYINRRPDKQVPQE